MGIGLEERQLLGLLKDKPRTGWVNRSIPLSICETTRQHSIKVAIAAKLYAKATGAYDPQLCYNLGLIHDICDIAARDYTPDDAISAEEKRATEWRAVRKVTSGLGSRGADILRLWEMYEHREIPEAQPVYEIDKLDPSVQALEYEKLGYDVAAFYPYTRARLTQPLLLAIFDELTLNRTSENSYRRYFRMLRAGKAC